MPSRAAALVAAHRLFGTPADIVRDRRVLFRALATVVGSPLAAAADGVLDNPVVRGRLGAAFVDGGPAGTGTDLAELVASGCAVDVAGWPVRVASTPSAPRLLEPALRGVREALRAHGDHDAGPLVVTGDRVRSVLPIVLAGIRLAVDAVPELAGDLLQHLALVALTDRRRSGRLGSASERDHPGLIVLPEPESPAEVAEALVHEGTHLVFFDLGVTRELLADGHWTAPAFRPSWAAATAPAWPMEQTFAAWHAYTALAALAESGIDPAPGSLLPRARERAAELGEQVLHCGRYLGRDGHLFVTTLLGRAPRPAPAIGRASAAPVLAVHRSGRRTLTVRAGHPPELVWTQPDIAAATL
ncbi:aKG-HExxH-type peptide beta-hydroxylase [Pseudonocardia sp. CA-107938]|uniref:aKG-HExxH-type peptide beta-hydroxylase n=1 Tax=Pseudonocardia sp. CA-107938 TaxID=3240021 RepID=UPI003D8CB8E7